MSDVDVRGRGYSDAPRDSGAGGRCGTEQAPKVLTSAQRKRAIREYIMIPTGRELDARLWELTGGVVVARDWPCWEDECGERIAETARRDLRYGEEGYPVYVPTGGCWPPDKDGFAYVEPVPFFSDDDMAALLLVERLQTRGWNVAVYFNAATASPHWKSITVIVVRPDDYKTYILPECNQADTLHEALANAAYAALAKEAAKETSCIEEK